MKRKIGLIILLFLCISVITACGKAGTDSDGTAGAGNESANAKNDKKEEKSSFLPDFSGVSEGDIVSFGSYEQNNNADDGKEPIEWYVLEKSDNEVTLLSVKVLGPYQRYNLKSDYVTWETCTLRTWLNEDFYNEAFNSDEKTVIKETTLKDEQNPHTEATPGNDTTDKVWLLSVNEVEKYFNIDGSMYEKYQNQEIDSDELAEYCVGQDERFLSNAAWWLRTGGSYGNFAACVEENGFFYCGGYFVNQNKCRARPAIKVSY